MSTSTRSGIKLSNDEFHGIMAAVARRINRMAMTGHPDGSIHPPPDNGVGQGSALPPGQRVDPVPSHSGVLDDLVYRPQTQPGVPWAQKGLGPFNLPNLPPPPGRRTNI